MAGGVVAGPSTVVLAAFGIPHLAPLEHLEGGQGETWATPEVILKPVTDLEEATWAAETLRGLGAPGLRIPHPFAASDGRHVVEGWACWERVAGTPHEKDMVLEKVDVARRLHAALRDVPRPAFLDRRDNPWAIADRFVWGDGNYAPSLLYADLVERLLSAWVPIDDSDAQVIHGDLGGNVLFQEGYPPAVIDFTPYFRPAAYGEAVICADAALWWDVGTSVFDAIRDRRRRQLLLRAALARVVASDLLGRARGGTQDAAESYRRGVQLILEHA